MGREGKRRGGGKGEKGKGWSREGGMVTERMGGTGQDIWGGTGRKGKEEREGKEGEGLQTPQTSLPQRYYTDPEINLYAAYHAVHDESAIQSRRPLLISPEQPMPSLRNCHAHSLKTAKILANS